MGQTEGTSRRQPQAPGSLSLAPPSAGGPASAPDHGRPVPCVPLVVGPVHLLPVTAQPTVAHAARPPQCSCPLFLLLSPPTCQIPLPPAHARFPSPPQTPLRPGLGGGGGHSLPPPRTSRPHCQVLSGRSQAAPCGWHCRFMAMRTPLCSGCAGSSKAERDRPVEVSLCVALCTWSPPETLVSDGHSGLHFPLKPRRSAGPQQAREPRGQPRGARAGGRPRAGLEANQSPEPEPLQTPFPSGSRAEAGLGVPPGRLAPRRSALRP